MRCLTCFLTAIAVVSLWTSGSSFARAQAQPAATTATMAEMDQLAAVLKSDQPHAAKLAACKRLARIGDKNVVPALALLLSDEKMSHPARIALEAIPDPVAAAALRAALPRLHGSLLVGVINSLGARRDAEAVPDLTKLLDSVEVEAAVAAAAALGKIGGPQAGQALEKKLAAAEPQLQRALGEACLACAETLWHHGEAAAAAKLYERVRGANLPKQICLTATRGAILTQPTSSVQLLNEQLKAANGDAFAMAVEVSSELPAPEVTQALAERLPTLSAERQVMVLAALAQRADSRARPAVVQAAQNPDQHVRAAALRALGVLGDASSIPLLLKVACEPSSKTAAAAQESLATLNDPGVDTALAEMIDKTSGKTRRTVSELAGQRRIAAAVPALLKAADDVDPEIRLAAIAALGKTIDAQRLPALLKKLTKPLPAAEMKTLEAALRTACTNPFDQEGCAKSLVECLPTAAPPAKQLLLELLGLAGGQTALTAVAAAARDKDEQIQDAATRVLGEWATPDAALSLFALTQKPANAKFRTRALRGGLRILRQMDLPDPQRLALCREALKLAERDDERSLALTALARIPSPEALALVLQYLPETSLQEPACAAAVTIAKKLAASHPEPAAKAMQQVIQTTRNNGVLRQAKEVLLQTKQPVQK